MRNRLVLVPMLFASMLVAGVLALVAIPSAVQAQSKCKLHQVLLGTCDPRKSSSAKTGSASGQSGAAAKEAPEKEQGPAWSYTAKAKPSPDDIIQLPNAKKLWEWQRQSAKSEPARNPKRYASTGTRSFPQEPWFNRIPFFKDPKIGVYTSDFGWRLLDRRDFHGGIDVKAPVGTEVYSPISGEVIRVSRGGTASGVVVQSGDVQHSFWHVRPKRGIAVGQRLKVGDLVGGLAAWGINTHLHYAIHITGKTGWSKDRKDSNSIDPFYVLEKNGLYDSPHEYWHTWRVQNAPLTQDQSAFQDQLTGLEALALPALGDQLP